jgi:hypothetical protein
MAPTKFTIIDRQAFKALGTPFRAGASVYLDYLRFCRDEAKRLRVTLNQHNRALWQRVVEIGRAHGMRALGLANAVVGALLLPLPTPRVGIPNTVGEQQIQIGKVWIAVDEEMQALAIFFARPLAVPHLPSRIIGMEVGTAER